MKIFVAVLVAGLAAMAAQAAAGEPVGAGPGHWAWVSDPIVGPKSSPANRHQIWIPDRPVAAAAEGPGHWQWVSELAAGPRAGPATRHRIWVSGQ